MDIAAIKQLITDGKIEYVKVGAPDIEGVYRGKRVAAKFFLDSLADGFAQCDVLFGWDIAENVLPNLKFSNWERGFADVVMKPDLDTFALVPWEEHVASCVCDVWSEHGDPVEISPRYLLQNLVERARSMGFEPLAASELEFRFFRENQMSLREKDFGPNLTPLNPGMNCYAISQATADDQLLGRIARMMRDHGIEIEGYNREHGAGMYEMNLKHATGLEAADRAMLFRNGVKEICMQQGLTATFMAKVSDAEDGCSGHLHQSLWDVSGTNLFHDPQDEHRLSSLARHYAAGVLQTLPELCALYAPTINSYKRYVAGSWAPTALTWGVETRTTALRAVPGSPRSTRLENRVPGADANPYLAMAASIAAGLHGIEQRLELPPPARGNAYALTASEAPHLPRSLHEAVERLASSAVARDYLGGPFVDHYLTMRRWEVDQYNRVVDQWQRERYMEMI